ncbi:MAG TPA: hypothetical protein VKB73_15350 [Gaiellaceae bacterium]|nr:hypothetical protein [Gaiellaceae bacterium]
MRPRPSRRVLLVVLVAVTAAVVARVAAPASRHLAGSVGPCGFERWTVKTLQDRPRLLPVEPTSLAHLTGIPRPALVPAWRLPFERHVFSVIASATFQREESDQDYHVILRVGSRQMIAEAPNAPSCTPNATGHRRREMRRARRAVRRSCARAHVVGVASFDYNHGQTGVAPNAIELHPIVGYSCLSP